MTQPDLHLEAKRTTLNAISESAAKVSTLLDEQRYSDIVPLTEGLEAMCRGLSELAEAERIESE